MFEGLILDWWTTLLHLLLDDNFTVRQTASQVVYEIESKNKNVECHFGVMRRFFQNFLNSVGQNNPPAGLAALFTWSITLMEDEEFEMDDTDVSIIYLSERSNWISIRSFRQGFLENRLKINLTQSQMNIIIFFLFEINTFFVKNLFEKF